MYMLKLCACLSSQAQPESLLMLWGSAMDEAAAGDAGLFLHVGLSNGVMQRTEVDRTTGGAPQQHV
jgi:splicing factor 3B subunit 3